MPGIRQLTLLGRFSDISTEETFHLVFNDTYEFSRKNLGKIIKAITRRIKCMCEVIKKENVHDVLKMRNLV